MIRFAVLYFVLLVAFILLFFGPIIAAKFIDLGTIGKSIPLDLMQPTGQNQNDTFSSVTGSALGNFGGGAAATGDSGSGGGGGGGDTTAAPAATSSSGPFDFNAGTGKMAVRWVTIA